MENLLQELAGIVKLPFNEISHDFKIIMISNKVIYVCNYIKILDYGDCRLVLKVYKNQIEILGSNLFISQINKNEIVIKGNINSYTLLEGNNDKKSEK